MPICAVYLTADDIPVTFDKETKVRSITLVGVGPADIAELGLTDGSGNIIARLSAEKWRVTHINYGTWPFGNVVDACTVSVLNSGEVHIIYERDGETCPI